MRINSDLHDSVDIEDMLAVSAVDVVLLELTTRCNLRCVYCSHSRPYYQNIDMSDADLRKAIDLLLRIRPASVCINGHGETTIYPDWHILCNQLLDCGIHIDIISNLAKQYANEEIDILSRIRTIQVSMDTADPVLFKQLRRGGSLENAIGTMYKIRSQAAAAGRPSPKFAISCVVSDKTIFGLADLVKLGNQIGILDFSFNDLYELPPLGEGCLEVLHISSLPDERILQAGRALSNAISLINNTGRSYYMHSKIIETISGRLKSVGAGDSPVAPASGFSNQDEWRAEGRTRNCTDPWRKLYMRADGEIWPCCFHGRVCSLNDATNDDDIINCEGLRKLRRQMLSGDLPSCCQTCQISGWTAKEFLHQRVAAFMEKNSQAPACA